VKKHAIAALLAAAALTLAACGGNTGGQGHGSMDHGTGPGGDHSQRSSQGGETSSEEMAAMSREMVMPNGEYSDKAFIDAMVPHHEGAVEMAEVALKQAEHPEIKEVAEDIVSSQRAEIGMFGEIRERRYGSAESNAEMDEMDMRAMGMSDPRELAQADPFDKAFIDEMIPHHESAIAMARVALEESEDGEIRRIARDIVSAQEREIAQMKEWREEWYPQG
jgi:uncharacterized protein (DUF305 family)